MSGSITKIASIQQCAPLCPRKDYTVSIVGSKKIVKFPTCIMHVVSHALPKVNVQGVVIGMTMLHNHLQGITSNMLCRLSMFTKIIQTV